MGQVISGVDEVLKTGEDLYNDAVDGGEDLYNKAVDAGVDAGKYIADTSEDLFNAGVKAIKDLVIKKGGDGNDSIEIDVVGEAYGNGGDDTLKAYALYVKLDGGSGNDTIKSNSGVSKLYGVRVMTL